MKRTLLAGLFILFFALPLFAQVDTAWVRTYNGPGDSTDYVYDIAVDGLGNVYVTGNSFGSGTDRDYAAIKYLPNGDTAWVRRYNGPGNGSDFGIAMVVDNSGNVYVTGYSDAPGGGTYFDWDFATIKYFPNGDTAWVRRYNGPDNGEDGGSIIGLDGSGNVYVIGRSFSIETQNDYTIIKYYPNGDTAWMRRYDGPGNTDDWPYGAAVDGLGNVYVTGMSWINWGLSDYTTLKFDPVGNLLWARSYNGPGNNDDWASGVAVDGSGNVYVTGFSWGSGTETDYATIKYYPNGDTAWVRRYNGPGNGFDFANDLAVDDSENVYVTGESWGELKDLATPNYPRDGDSPWVKRYRRLGSHYDLAQSVTLDGSNYFSPTGGGKGSQNRFDFATVKYYPNGDTAWIRRYNGPGNGYDAGFDLALDRFDNLYVTGLSWGGETNSDYPVIKYYPNGDTAWLRRYNGPGNSFDDPSAVAVDHSNNVYLTGMTYYEVGDEDYATVKYCQPNEPPDAFSLLFPFNKAFTPRVIRFHWETATDPNPSDQVTYDLYVSTSYHSFLDSATIDSNLVASEHTRTLDYGTYYWKVIAKDNSGAERESNQIRYFMVTGIHASLGDFNGDGCVDVADVVFLINYLYTSGPAPDPLELGDVNCDEGVNIADVIFLINYLFKNGPAPSC